MKTKRFLLEILLSLSHKFRLERHGAKAIYFAINIMVTFRQSDIFHFCPGLDRLWSTLYR